MKKLKNSVAVVTGAGGTLCSEIARNLAKQGVKVALLGRTLTKLEKVKGEIEDDGGTAMAIAADVVNEQDLWQAFEKVKEAFGTCHILINGAGGNQAEAITGQNLFDPRELQSSGNSVKGFFNLSMEAFKNVLEVNTMGSVIPCFVFGREMAGHKAGTIINIASMNSYRPLSRVGAYGMAKAGIVNFTQWLAAYLAPANIRVNAIAPGFFLNDRSREILLTGNGYSERGSNIIRQTPMSRFGEAPELTGCVNWLIDEEASGFVTGITIPVDGGFLANSGV